MLKNLVSFINSYNVGLYGFATVMLVYEIWFDFGIILMLMGSGYELRRIRLVDIFKFKITHVNLRLNDLIKIGFLLNRAASIIPYLYILILGYKFLPPYIIFLLFVGIIINIFIVPFAKLFLKPVVALRKKLYPKVDVLKIRQANLLDLDSLCELEKKSWPGRSDKATHGMFKARIETFPKGGVVAESNGKIVGMVFFMRLNKFDATEQSTWYSITGNGYIKDTHDPNGSYVYGVTMLVDQSCRGKKIATKMMKVVAKYVIKNNIKAVFLGSRLPTYYKYSYLTSEQYVKSNMDPEINLYQRQGFKVEKIIPDFFYDKDSLNYGVLIKWKNPFYIPLIGKSFGIFFQYLVILL